MKNFFRIAERGTTVKTEILAGMTTFFTMAYILPVNTDILSQAGLDGGAVFMATALAAIVGTTLMGLYADLPFAQAPAMGLNAFFTYTVVLTLGCSPAIALAAVFVEGLIFLALSLSGIRTELLRCMPHQLRLAISAGIGLFIMFIGLRSARIIVAGPALVQVNPDLLQASVLLSVVGIAVTVALYVKHVKCALLAGILITWTLGMAAQVSGWYQVNAEAGQFSLFPAGIVSAPPGLAPTFGLFWEGLKGAFAHPQGIGEFAVVVLTFLYVDIFDTLGTFAGLAVKARLMDENGNFPGAGRAFTSDAVATTVGAVLGTGTVTTYVESASGVEAGGRTGLTALTTAALFLLAVPFYPIVSVIPSFATAPALVVIGIMMCGPMRDFQWDSMESLIPGVFTIIFMVVGYSISSGIMWGVLFYLFIMTIFGKRAEIATFMWVIGFFFLFNLFIFPMLK
jgi:AGZA family xanthine/uracil permease-like MFS transporter